MSTSPGSAPGGGTRWGQSRTTLLVALGVVLVVVAALLIWSLTRDDDDPAGKGSPTSREPGDSASASATASPKPGSATRSPGGKASRSPSTGSTGGPVNEAKPQSIGFDQTGRPARGVDLDVVKVENVRGQAQIPGEVSGPALRITVRVTNRTDKPVAIDNVVSNLYYGGDRRPATPMLKPGSRAFPSSARPEGTASGVLLFNVPRSGRDKLVLEVILDAQLRTVEFNGACPADC